MEIHRQLVLRVAVQMMEKHTVAPVLDWDISVDTPVRIDAHSGERVSALAENGGDELVIVREAGADRLKIALLAERKL